VSASKAEYATATGTVLISGDTTLPLAVSLIAPSPPTPADLTGYWSGTGDYFHAPFKLALVQSGNTLRGDYLDSHDDTWDVSGIYAPTGFTLRVNFGDTAIMLECNSFENAREIRGVQRVQGRAYNFTMTR